METFGRYQLQAQLGQGGMGVVYRAFDTVLQRVVALKLVLSPEELDPEMRERFFREARAAAHLSHKNVVTIYDLGEHEGRPFLAMEFLEGEDLHRRLARPERMSLGRKLELATEICLGVEYAHAHGVIHRDLKPANIYVTADSGAKILDFGLARLMTSQLTKSNMLMGTLNYMAPEQVRGERADQRSDVFAVGVVLYELFGGRKAFEGDSVASTLYKILQEAPEPLAKVDPSLPRELTAIVERALAKLRDERYPDMSTLRRDLEAASQTHQGTVLTPRPSSLSSPDTVLHTAPPVDMPARSAPVTMPSGSAPPAPPSGALARGAGIKAAIAVGVLLLVAAGWFMFSRSQPAPGARSSATVERPDDPIAARLRDAQTALDAKNYAAALTTADAVLLQAPQHADAVRIRNSARQGAIEDALARGSRHLKSGDTGEAIKAAGEVLALAPDSAAARAILEQAAGRTHGPDAEAARRRMSDARAAAEDAGARKLATPAFAKAARTGQDADRLFSAKRFADAAARYYEASGLYHGADVAARASTPATQAPAMAPPPEPAPKPAVAAAAPSPTPPSEPAPKPSAAVPAPPLTLPAPAAPPVTIQPVPAPAVSSAPAAAPEAGPAPPPPAADERIGELLGHYREALESRSFDQLKRLWPSLSGAAESAIRQEFQHAVRITVDIIDPQISVSGGSGRVGFIRRYSLVTVEGQHLQSTSSAVMEVKRAGAAWVIERIRFTSR